MQTTKGFRKAVLFIAMLTVSTMALAQSKFDHSKYLDRTQTSSAAKADSTDYVLQPIVYPGSNLNRAQGINNSGVVVGSFRVTPPQHPYILKSGQFQPIQLPTSNFAVGFGINDKGDTAGIWLPDGADFEHGWMFTKDGQFIDIMFPGSLFTDARSINNDGTVVGYFGFDENSVHCFVYANGTYSQFDVPGASDTVCLGLNARGQIVGNWDSDINTVGHGFLLDPSGQLTSFDHPLALPNSTQFSGINDRGEVVGGYDNASGGIGAFIRHADGRIEDISLSVPNGVPSAINNAGQIVGNFRVLGIPHAFIATPATSGKKN